MKRTTYIALFLMVFSQSCAQEVKNLQQANPLEEAVDIETEQIEEQRIIESSGTTIETRILPPNNFQRTQKNKGSYSHYLVGLPLKPHGSEVMLFNGQIKSNYNVYEAVVDLKIGNKDLHQCADAIMRLRAEYLWNEKRYDEIHFNFTNGFRVDYSKWMEGKRMVVKGNKTYWVDKASPSNTYQDFWNYMELIFNYAGTLSLSKELVPVDLKDIQIGDVFIWGGSPGHAVLVIDMAINVETGEKVFVLAQSYMPAQETQVLKNPNNSDISPWYSLSEIGEELVTPEWTFQRDDLKRFKE